MELPSRAIIELLTYLLPGFITAAILHNLTPAPRPIPFERVVQALIFTVIVQVLTLPPKTVLLWLGSVTVPLGEWTDETQVAWSVSIAVLLGLVLAYVANTDCLHSRLRGLQITQQTSYSSEWYGALSQNKGFIVLHLVGQRRLYGWAEEWPSTPDKGHFVMMLCEWLVDDNSTLPLRDVERVLVNVSEVEMVELMTTEKKIEESNG